MKKEQFIINEIKKVLFINQPWVNGLTRPFEFDPNSTENEGRFRLYPPDLIDEDTYYRLISPFPGISYIMGYSITEGKEVIQAIRFDLAIWDIEKATKWWEEHGEKYTFYTYPEHDTEKVSWE